MQYLFLAIPNFCGSTLVHNLLATCPAVVQLTHPEPFIEGLIEGDQCTTGIKNLHGPHSIEATMENVYANPKNYDWKLIKEEWDQNWNKNDPTATIRLQKSPSDIFRVKMITKHFTNLKWVVSVRNPYSHIESIVRKASHGLDPVGQLDQICYHAIRSLEVQRENKVFLGNNAYTMTYEDFCTNTDLHTNQLGKFIPGLENITINSQIYDDSAVKLQKMINKYPGIIAQINKFVEPKKEILDYWGYEIINT